MCVCVLSYEDDLTGQHFKVRTAFQVGCTYYIAHALLHTCNVGMNSTVSCLQVYVQPGSYSVDAVTEHSNSPSQSQLAWTTTEQTYIVHALLIQMIPVTPHDY